MEFFKAIQFYTSLFSPEGTRKMLREILRKKEVQKFIIELNQDQLYNLGEDSKGRSLGKYSPRWTIVRQERGLRTDHVTLYFDGIFYKSFFISVNDNGFVQDADPERGDVNLYDRFGVDIIGLNDENTELLIERLREEIILYIERKAEKAAA